MQMPSEKANTLKMILLAAGRWHSEAAINLKSKLSYAPEINGVCFGKYRNCNGFSFHSYKFIFPFRDRNWHLPRMIGGLSVGQRA